MPSKLSQNSQPYLYEINTWPWLEAISRTEGRAIDLGTVPDRYWDEIADLGFDGVWLMGVWQRSPAGIAIALTNDDLRVSFDAALPDWQPYDVVGSPYCVRGYVVDDHFGGRSALASARAALAARGMGLILDFVPNHVAPDHPCTRASRSCQYAAELAKIIVHGDLVAQTLLRRDEHAFRLPRLDSGARDSPQLCGDCD